MTMKRIVPILLLLALVISLAACQSSPADEAVDAPVDAAVAGEEQPVKEDSEPAAVQQPSEPVVEEAEEPVVEDVAEPPAVDIPEFVPPEPATLDTAPEAIALALGDPDAPVQIVEFTDYGCPYCRHYAQETMPALLENLVESGRVYFVIKDLPLDALHPEARAASVAARCAGEQDAYLAMHDALFATQEEWSGTSDGANGGFAGLAADLDLDAGAFEACVAGAEQAERVQANVDEAMALGINGTPFFFLDGYGLSGAQPYELFEAAVELAENDELDDVIEAQAREYYDAMVAQAEAMARQAAEPVEVSLENAHVLGDTDAPVTIVEYTDFQCPYCARHALETFPQIEEDLVETGKVRYVFKALPLTSIHPQAMLAAEASRCAGAQDGYLAMHTKLFEEQEAWSGQADAAELFAGYAAEIGLDGETFASCLENHDTIDPVQADMEEAISAGITGTPAFLINGRLVSGAMPFEAFEQAVEAAIAEGAGQPAGN